MSNPFISQPINTAVQPTFNAPAPSQPIPAAAPVAQAAPVQSQSTPTYAQPQGPSGLDDPQLYSGHNTPLLPNTLDGRWGLKILSVCGAKGYESGPAVHISFEILSSTNPAVKVGETYRVFYKFDYERMMPVTGKQGTVHAGLLGKFVAALYRREYNDPSFSKTEALAAICTNARGGKGHDFASQPGYVELVGELRGREVTDPNTKVVTKSNLRSDIWLPAPVAA